MQKTAYEMRISDWSSDVCSSDLRLSLQHHATGRGRDKPRHDLEQRGLAAAARTNDGREAALPQSQVDPVKRLDVALRERLAHTREHVDRPRILRDRSHLIHCRILCWFQVSMNSFV